MIRGCMTREPFFDRAHNVFLDWLIAGGIVGLLAYLSIFAAAFLYLAKKRQFLFSNGKECHHGSFREHTFFRICSCLIT